MKRFTFVVLSLLTFPAYATQVQEVTTPGGLKAWLVEEHGLPLVSVKIVFRDAGFAYDVAGKEGRASMTAASLLEGAGDMDSRSFNEALEDNAIRLNFATDEDLFRVSLETLSERKEKAFSYLGATLTKPRFDTPAIERVRGQTLSLLTAQEGNPGYLMERGWQKMAYGEHPYGKPVLGFKESVNTLNAADFSDFMRRYLTRENILIAVVGDIAPTELASLLDAHLSALPEHYEPDVRVEEARLPATAQETVIPLDIPQTMVAFGAQGVKRDDPLFYAAYVMNQAIGGGGSLTSRLGQEIRDKRGLAYSVYSMVEPMSHGAKWGGGFATRSDQAGAALETLRTTLKDFAQNGPTDKELADAKNFLTGSFVLGLDSNGDIASYLISMQLNKLGRDYLDKRNEYMSAVTKEQAKQAAARLVSPDSLLVVMVGQPKLTK